jgi:leucyl/phenylalanyl-tRNA---protein transferase
VETLTPEIIVNAYASGYFPMADPEEGNQIYWYRPDPRALIPLETFHIPRRLSRTMRRNLFEVRLDVHFRDVILACADRSDTWLSAELIDVFIELHRLGMAHSVACFRGGELVGGVYGLALGKAFFAESMFRRQRDASKVALVHLAQALRASGFRLFDVQFATEHLRQFGLQEVSAEEYDRKLMDAIDCGIDDPEPIRLIFNADRTPTGPVGHL